MSDDNAPLSVDSQSIKAKKFDAPPLPGSAPQEKPSAVSAAQQSLPWWHSEINLLICVFVLLAVAAFMLVQIAPAPQLEVGAPDEVASKVKNNAADDTAPWDESRRAQARSDSQDILSTLLSSKKQLESTQVETWAPRRFAAALAAAEAGDDLYKLQNYPQALASYQSAVDQLDALHREIPTLVEQQLGKGAAALDAGKSALAIEAFRRALALDQDNLIALEMMGRAEKLDQVLALSQRALEAQQQFQREDKLAPLQQARELLQQAEQIDPQYQKIKTQLIEVERQIQDKQFRSAMTRGFTALFNNQFVAANNAFAEALQIAPDDNMAQTAYAQSLAANKTSSLQSLLNQAAQLERKERWQGALSNYESVLQRDANMVAARLGQIRSRVRAELDRALRRLISDPLALSKSGQATSAEAVLADARAIVDSGPLLRAQIASLEQALNAVTADVKIRLSSDAMTEVSLRKEGASQVDLGRFTNKNLALKPGRYVLTAKRLGYHDERLEIELNPGASMQSFSIRCTKPVNAGAAEASR